MIAKKLTEYKFKLKKLRLIQTVNTTENVYKHLRYSTIYLPISHKIQPQRSLQIHVMI
jgi:hypothetical protein